MRGAWPLLALVLTVAPASALLSDEAASPQPNDAASSAQPTDAAASTQPAEAGFFESRIRPVLARHCYGCHSSKLEAPRGDLALDTKAGLARGGRLGPEIVPGRPEESRLIHALSHKDPALAMPPTGKLPDDVIADFERWIAEGAVDPRIDPADTAPARAPLAGMPIEEGRRWWAFQPVRARPTRPDEPAGSRIDAFIGAALEGAGLTMSPPADRRTLAVRAYLDLVGYRPTYEEVEAFVTDASPDAWLKLIDRLLASPHYGERWARHWMDVARFGEDNSTTEATNPPYPFAWRYRDWLIEALNADVPYDRFITLQLAADKMPGTPRADLRALGYLGAAPVYHKDQRLSAEVIYGFMTDDWDERIDAVTRGVLGLTVACARCHDHKFDPILTRDYYALMGVFASTMRAERPLFDVEPAVERRYLWVQRRLFDLYYSANLATREATTFVEPERRVAAWKAEIAALEDEMTALQGRYPKLVSNVERFFTVPPPPPPPDPTAPPPPPAPPAPARNPASAEPFMQAVYDAAQYVNGEDPTYTFIDYEPGEARHMPILRAGSVTSPGETARRGYLTVLSQGDPAFTDPGSGRLELAERIFSDSPGLAARVIVNRVWGWHFGRPLVPTTSDFGVQGEKPSHPELLDDLAARFIAGGWSLKWLHREIMSSAAYQQSSRPRPEAEAKDPVNALLWRMNPRRLDIESYRDSLLRAAGLLDPTLFGVSDDVLKPDFRRRTIYARVSRSNTSALLRTYDFPDPNQTSPGRDLTTTSLQQLFVMNSAFVHDVSSALAEAVSDRPMDEDKVRGLYRKVLARDPTIEELAEGRAYLAHGTPRRLAQILLATNEEIFWP